jgi:hypothetical protein
METPQDENSKSSATLFYEDINTFVDKEDIKSMKIRQVETFEFLFFYQKDYKVSKKQTQNYLST